jgi:hypothetical protein
MVKELTCIQLTIFTKSYSLDRTGGKAKTEAVAAEDQTGTKDEEAEIEDRVGEKTLVDVPMDLQDLDARRDSAVAKTALTTLKE